MFEEIKATLEQGGEMFCWILEPSASDAERLRVIILEYLVRQMYLREHIL